MPTVMLDHSELIRGVQAAMAAQLVRDGRLTPAMELGLTFYAPSADDVTVVAQVRRHGTVLFELNGHKPQLTAVATQLALARLSPRERSRVQPVAQVRWRLVEFREGEQSCHRFLADVEFQPKAVLV